MKNDWRAIVQMPPGGLQNQCRPFYHGKQRSRFLRRPFSVSCDVPEVGSLAPSLVGVASMSPAGAQQPGMMQGGQQQHMQQHTGQMQDMMRQMSDMGRRTKQMQQQMK